MNKAIGQLFVLIVCLISCVSILNTFNSSCPFLCFLFYRFSLFLKCVCVSGIGGLVGMKLIYGTTAARKRAKAGKEDKVRKGLYSPITLSLVFFLCILLGPTYPSIEFHCSLKQISAIF